MDRGAWRATIHGVTELDTTAATEHKVTLGDNVSKCHLLICKMEIITVPFSKPGEEFTICPGA